MEALECIKTRRSIRKFTEQPVTEDEVRQVVEAAAFAPSWKNTQIARYIVVTDKEKEGQAGGRLHAGLRLQPEDHARCTGTGRADHDQGSLRLRARRLIQHPACCPLAVLLTRALPRRPSACPRMRSVSARLLWVFTIPLRLPRSWKSPKVRKWPRSSRSVIRHRTRRRRRVRMSIRCCDLSKSAYFEHRGSNSAVLFFSRHKVAGAHELPQAGSPPDGRLLFCTG